MESDGRDSEILAGPMVQGNEMIIKIWFYHDLKAPGDEPEKRGGDLSKELKNRKNSKDVSI